MCPLAPRPPGAGRVGRAYSVSRSALTARGSREARDRAPCSPVIIMSRGTPRYAPGSPGRPLQACGRVRRAEDARVFAVLSFKRPAFTLPPIAVTAAAGHPPRQPPRSAPSRSPTWTRPRRPDPAACPPLAEKARNLAFAAVDVENDAPRSRRTGDLDAALVLTCGELRPAPRRQASRREDPARCLRGAAPTARRRRSAFSRRRPEEVGAAAEKSVRSKVWTPAGLSLPRVGMPTR